MPRARRFRGSLLVMGFLAGSGAALAQELQFDAKALDTSGAVQTKRKSKKGVEAEAQQPAPAAGKGGPNRQFGELEGWSPGKAPPRAKDKYDPNQPPSASGNKAPVSVTPSGGMNVGLPF